MALFPYRHYCQSISQQMASFSIRISLLKTTPSVGLLYVLAINAASVVPIIDRKFLIKTRLQTERKLFTEVWDWELSFTV